MAQQLPTDTNTHPDYMETVRALETVRDCVAGSWKIKRAKYRYLPHPSQIDTESEEQKARYDAFIAAAEFDEYPSQSLRSWLGKMQFGKASIEIPDRIAYLEQNCDGDGTPLTASMESCASNVFQAKYHVLVADYQGLSDVELNSLSKADVQELNPHATIKQYTRESLVDWDYRRINGVMQLAYLKLREVGYDFNIETGHREKIESYLILALDDDGNYYQQKEVDGVKGEYDYVVVAGKPLTWIPAEIVADDELPVGSLPQGMGMLYPICEASLQAYIDSAYYAEARRTLIPTTFTTGWRMGSIEVFKEANGGRDYVVMGPNYTNNLPEGVAVEMKSVDDKTQAFERYIDRTKKKIQSFGGAVKEQADANKTATQADIDSANEVAMLSPVADNIERAYRRVVSYCAMFEGVFSPDDVEHRLDEIIISLPRDFASPKLSVEEVRTIMEMVGMGLRTVDQAVRQLAAGGWDYQEAERTLAELGEATPTPSMLLRQMVDTGQTSD